MKTSRNLFLRLLEQSRSLQASSSSHGVDPRSITATIERALASAGLVPRSGVSKHVTDTVEQALASAGLGARYATPSAAPVILEGDAHEVASLDAPAAHEQPAVADAPFAPVRSGEFVTRSFTGAHGSLNYKLYVPASHASAPEARRPLVVMLHGCTQDPDDFAAGTRMNALADQHGFVVVYPAQAHHANISKCWNWFSAQNQERDAGEPALIAGITREVAAGLDIDQRRIFVAGLSAGAAMAMVLGATYPDLFAAVGVHSGLPYGSAHDVPSAFAAMRGAAAGSPVGPQPGAAHADGGSSVPTIIFHGDADATVHASNADAILAQARARSRSTTLGSTSHRGTTPGGRAYTRTVLADGTNPPIVEQWLLHGGGHAWSGGDPSGSYTDERGPDASSEMIRFFYCQRRAGIA